MMTYYHRERGELIQTEIGSVLEPDLAMADYQDPVSRDICITIMG